MSHTAFAQLTEAEIIERVLNGEKPLYEVIMRRFNPYLYKIGRSYNYNHEDTEDLMQDTYIDAYKNLANFEQRSNFRTWLVRIMLNNCYRKKEKSSYKNEFANGKIGENATPMYDGSSIDTVSQIQNNQLQNVIEDALANIPEEYRLVFSLREMSEFNVKETAGMLGITESNVKVRLNRAKTMLRAHLEKQNIFAELYDYNMIFCNPFTSKVMALINVI